MKKVLLTTSAIVGLTAPAFAADPTAVSDQPYFHHSHPMTWSGSMSIALTNLSTNDATDATNKGGKKNFIFSDMIGTGNTDLEEVAVGNMVDLDGDEERHTHASNYMAAAVTYINDHASISVAAGSAVEDGLGAEQEDTYGALNGYYTPDSDILPSISVGYEVGEDASKTTLDEITSFFVGLQWDEVGPGSFGVAMGHSGTLEGADEEYMYEAYYSYAVNDGMTITPVIYTKDNATAGQDDTTGVLVKTSFSF